jgi:hypothetical protein
MAVSRAVRVPGWHRATGATVAGGATGVVEAVRLGGNGLIRVAEGTGAGGLAGVLAGVLAGGLGGVRTTVAATCGRVAAPQAAAPNRTTDSTAVAGTEVATFLQVCSTAPAGAPWTAQFTTLPSVTSATWSTPWRV